MRNPSSSSSGHPSAPEPPPSSSPSPSSAAPHTSKPGLKRGPWTPEEDLLLSNYIKKEGEGKWRTLPKKAGLLRCGKSCRLRWMNYLRPSVKRGHIAPDEEDLILRLHRLLGNRWSLIAGRIPGRTDNEVKNYWNTHLSKKLISQGIDPRTHKPLLVEPDYDNKQQPPAPSSICTGTRATPRDRGILAPDHHPPPPPPPNATTNDSTFALPFVEPQEQRHIAATLEGNIHHDQNNFLPSSEMTTTTAGNGIEDTICFIPNGADADDLYGINNEDDHEDINCCGDDVFSSFLNSLIAEDVFINSQSLEHDVDAAAALISPTSEPLFTFGPGWEAPATACPPSRDHENDSKMLNKETDNS